ncbi:hypothetical protein CRG98_024655, partial [Punica granatum]
METPPSFLELSTMEMAKGHKFEEYATNWRSDAAKHYPPICEAQQIQIFHGTLKGACYSHLMGHNARGILAVFSEFHARTAFYCCLRFAGGALSASTSCSTYLLFSFTGSTTCDLTTGCPPLYSRSASSPTVQTPGFESSSADITVPAPARSTGRHSTIAIAQAGAPEHTLDNCWRLHERIQEMIDAKELSFNAVRPLNDKSEQDDPSPFVIEYVPAEVTVGFTGFSASPTFFIIDVPTREPYLDNKVPWAYEGNASSLEYQFSIMGVTRSSRVYENPEGVNKGKAPATAVGTLPEVTPIPQKKRLKFILEKKLITVKGEEDYAIYKKTTVPYITIGDNENLPFHLFKTISVIRDYGKVGPSRADRMIGKVLLRNNYVPSTGLGPQRQGISCPIEVEEGITVLPLSHFFLGSPHIVGDTLDYPSSDSDNTPDALPAVCTVIEETPLVVHIRLAQENEELDNWTSVPQYSAMIADVLHSNPNLRCVDSNPSEELLEEPQPIYFGEGLDENGRVPEIEESLHRLENRQLTSVEPTEEVNVGTEEEPRTLKIRTGLDLIQRARMINFLKEYQEVFAWSYANMPSLDPSIVKHFFPLNTENFPPKWQHLRRQRANLLLRIREEVIKQIDARFLEVYNYFEWVANIVPVEKKDGRVRVCIDYRDLNKASPKDNFPLPYIDVLVDNTACHNQFSFMDGFSGYNQIRMAEKDKIKTTFITMWGTFCYKIMPFADPLKYLLGNPFSMRNIAKWRCQLTEYDIEYVPCTSIKGQAIADYLAEFLIEDDTPINSDFPDEGILQVDGEEDKPAWKMYFDSAVNSTGFGIGAVLISPDGLYYPIAAKVDFPCTNKVVEYESVHPWPAGSDRFQKELEVFGDSMLTIFQTLGQWKMKDAKLVPHHEYLEERLAAHYFLSEETLYRRFFDATLLRCVDKNEAQRFMGEIHEGSCGPHMSGLMLTKKLMRLGYFWSTMEADCAKHVRHCHLCQ